MKSLKINHLAVFTIIVIAQIIPALWYGLFTDSWMKLNNFTMDFITENQSSTPYIASVIGSLIITYTMAHLFTKMNITTGVQGLLTGALIGFAFTHVPNIVTSQFEFRPYALSWINGGVNIIIYAIAGFILGAWKKY
ncbi:MAG TPA: DUF1761 domain-containing protein [Saprospiraceae bacterium]|mgnify:FL=1|nr:DUF1761 domain-containing protein [Saprospiraceae bacterium]HMP22841.1 DUF1761 domain-containing protein [Saprospiraceae bacterium]